MSAPPLLYMREFGRVVIGDMANASGNEQLLRDQGVQVNILEDRRGIALYARYRAAKPDLDLEDWKCQAAVCIDQPYIIVSLTRWSERLKLS